jgi:hypothetical protein
MTNAPKNVRADLMNHIKDAIHKNQDGWTRHVMVDSAVDAIMALPAIATAQARIAELEAALSATDKALRVYGAKPDFYRVASHQAQEALKAKP